MNIKDSFIEVLCSILPVTLIITVLQFTIVKLPMDVFIKLIGGAFFVMIGLMLFLIGSKVGFLPIGEMIGSAIVEKGKPWLILLIGFIIGFVATIAEPDLQVLASQVYSVSEGAIGKFTLMVFVALGTGIFVALALLRMFLNIPISYMLIGGYILTFILSYFTPSEYAPVAFDAGGVTTGPMTVPFILSLGIGITAVLKRKGNTSDSFGLVALGSLGPILAVLILGVLYK